jgi:YidC/Oxa1 family membrane protein insertase
MEKRALVAIVLSLVVVVLWSLFFAPSSPPPQKEAVPSAPPGQPEKVLPPSSAAPETRPLSAPVGSTAAGPAASETLATVDTGVARLILTSQGASIRSVQLHAFRASLEENAPAVEISPNPGATTLPLAVELQLNQRLTSLGQLPFVPDQTELFLSPQQREGTLAFKAQLSDGTTVHRVYRFRHGSYAFDVDTRLEGLPAQVAGSMTLLWGPGLLQPMDEKVSRQGQIAVEPRGSIGGSIFPRKQFFGGFSAQEFPQKVGEAREKEGKVSWIALADTYFTAALISQQSIPEVAVVRRVEGDALTVGLRTPLSSAQMGQAVRVYVGPKIGPILEEATPSLGQVIDLGFFSPLARPMLQLLRFINGVVHNYGVTIIIVTILIKIAFWPLTQKSYKSMQAMQKLQPKIRELQVVYQDDKQALNRAMMQLYRDQKVNPMGGCLPMALQIPFFFAFYNALQYAVELRHAPFICWEQPLFFGFRGICDLSVYDPSYVTPILMGITMFIQQKMTPTVGDPAQAKVMQFMPLMFLFFFLWAPAGLVIYWLVNNILSIAQQSMINRTRPMDAAAVKASTTG